jgi:hypothetical protein
LWFFFWVAENDDKPFSSSSSYGFFLGLKKMTTSLPTHHHLMVFSLGYKRHSYDILGARMLWKPKEARILKNFINQPM